MILLFIAIAVLVVVATAILYTGFTAVFLWSAEAALLAWWGTRFGARSRYILTAAVILLFVTGVKYAGTDGAFCYTFPGETGPVTNLRSLACLVYAFSLAGMARQYRKSTEPSAPLFAGWLSAAAAAVIFTWATVTVNDIFSFAEFLSPPGGAHDLVFRRLMGIACTWTVCSIPFIWAGLRTGRSTLIVSGLAALLLAVTLVTIRGAAFHPIEIYRPGVNSRVAAFLVVFCGVAVHSALIDSYRVVRDWLPRLRPYLGLAAGVAFFSLLTGETRDLFEKMVSNLPQVGTPGFDAAQVLRLQNLQQLAISGVWLAYSAALLGVGIYKKSKGLRLISIGIVGLAILKIIIFDLSFLETLWSMTRTS